MENKGNEEFSLTAELIEDEDVLKFRSQTIDDETKDLSIIQPSGCVFTANYMKYHQCIQDFEVFEDDVFVATHPKCGTHWMQELVWCLRNDDAIARSKLTPLGKRSPFLEFSAIDNRKILLTSSFHTVDQLARPRTIKTHLPYDLLPPNIHQKKAKIIYVIRNPRDVCQSLLHHFRMLEKYTGELQTIINIMTNDLGFNFGPFFKNVLSYWKHRSDDNLFVVFYEEMQKDLGSVIERVADFLGITVTGEQVDCLKEHLSFKSMKTNAEAVMKSQTEKMEDNSVEKNRAVNESRLYNKGKSGSWKEVFTPEMVQQLEEWETKWLKDTDLKFLYTVE